MHRQSVWTPTTLVLNVTNETADIIGKKLLINYAINDKYDALTDDNRAVLGGSRCPRQRVPCSRHTPPQSSVSCRAARLWAWHTGRRSSAKPCLSCWTAARRRRCSTNRDDCGNCVGNAKERRRHQRQHPDQSSASITSSHSITTADNLWT